MLVAQHKHSIAYPYAMLCYAIMLTQVQSEWASLRASQHAVLAQQSLLARRVLDLEVAVVPDAGPALAAAPSLSRHLAGAGSQGAQIGAPGRYGGAAEKKGGQRGKHATPGLSTWSPTVVLPGLDPA